MNRTHDIFPISIFIARLPVLSIDFIQFVVVHSFCFNRTLCCSLDALESCCSCRPLVSVWFVYSFFYKKSVVCWPNSLIYPLYFTMCMCVCLTFYMVIRVDTTKILHVGLKESQDSKVLGIRRTIYHFNVDWPNWNAHFRTLH